MSSFCDHCDKPTKPEKIELYHCKNCGRDIYCCFTCHATESSFYCVTCDKVLKPTTKIADKYYLPER